MKIISMLNIKKVFSYARLFFVLKRLKECGKNIRLGYGFEIKGNKHIIFNSNIAGGKNIRIHAWEKYDKYVYHPEIIIGNNISFGRDVYISSINKIIIKDNVLVGDNVYISDNFHGDSSNLLQEVPPRERELYSKGPIIIEENVWIGRNVCIFGNVKIGKNAIIGANSVVVHDVEENSIVAGAPAKRIK